MFTYASADRLFCRIMKFINFKPESLSFSSIKFNILRDVHTFTMISMSYKIVEKYLKIPDLSLFTSLTYHSREVVVLSNFVL